MDFSSATTWVNIIGWTIFLIIIYRVLFNIQKWFVCDNGNCEMFREAKRESKDQKGYILNLIDWYAHMTQWRIVLVVASAAAVLVHLYLFKRIPGFIEFFITMILIFLPVYFMTSYQKYHSFRPVQKEVNMYIKRNCSAGVTL